MFIEIRVYHLGNELDDSRLVPVRIGMFLQQMAEEGFIIEDSIEELKVIQQQYENLNNFSRIGFLFIHKALLQKTLLQLPISI